jgi:hypothetical protein
MYGCMKLVNLTSLSRVALYALQRAALSLNYVLKQVGETALSARPRFSAASLFRTNIATVKGGLRFSESKNIAALRFPNVENLRSFSSAKAPRALRYTSPHESTLLNKVSRVLHLFIYHQKKRYEA